VKHRNLSQHEMPARQLGVQCQRLLRLRQRVFLIFPFQHQFRRQQMRRRRIRRHPKQPRKRNLRSIHIARLHVRIPQHVIHFHVRRGLLKPHNRLRRL